MYFLSALTGAVGLEPFPHVPNLEIRALRTIRKLECLGAGAVRVCNPVEMSCLSWNGVCWRGVGLSLLLHHLNHF